MEAGNDQTLHRRRRRKCSCSPSTQQATARPGRSKFRPSAHVMCTVSMLLMGARKDSSIASSMLLRPAPSTRIVPRSIPSSYTAAPNLAFLCHHRRMGVRLHKSPAGEYLENLSDGDGIDNITPNGDGVNGDGVAEEGDTIGAGETIEVYDDDDYAMSIPLPVRVETQDTDEGEEMKGEYEDIPVPVQDVEPDDEQSSDGDLVGYDAVIEIQKGNMESPSSINGDGIAEESDAMHPNEEPQLEDSNLTVAALDVVEYPASSSEPSIEASPPPAADEPESSESESDEKNKGIKSIIQNFLHRDDEDKSKEETERARKWSEWMKSGRKVRESDDGEGSQSDVALDESLLSVDKGADYVVVAVPPEVADGVGPILSSFPGGKLFQKTVGNVLQEDRVNGDTGGSSPSNTTSTQSPTVSIKKKSRQEKKGDKEEKEEDAEKKQRQRRDKHYRERREKEFGRISASDWRHNIQNIPNSSILRDIRNPVICVFVWATLWSIIHKLLTKMFEVGSGAAAAPLSPWMRGAAWLARHMNLPTVQHTMMTSAMSLLLVFRTNSAYQRFAEGRKIWNDIVDTTRDFSRMLKLYEFAIGTSKCRRINNLLASFPYLLRQRIRPSLMSFYRVNDSNVERDPQYSLLLYPDESLRDTDPEVGVLAYDEEETGASRRKTRELCWVDKRTLPWKLLPGSALELCARAQNRPLWVCDRMAKELAVVDDLLPKWTNRERLALIGYVDKLSRSIGGCERIHQTVVPLNYARHALRSLTVWLWTLPFVLVKDLGLLTGPVVAVVSWILFGVYEIGSRIEDPFQGTLRLSIYCDAIRRDVLADSIARDTAFDLEEEGKTYADEDGEYDAIFELDSESEEYDEDDTSAEKQRKRDFFSEYFGRP